MDNFSQLGKRLINSIKRFCIDNNVDIDATIDKMDVSGQNKTPNMSKENENSQMRLIMCYKFRELINFYINEDLPVFFSKTSFYGVRSLLKPLMLTVQRVFWDSLSQIISHVDYLDMNKAILYDSFCLSLTKLRKLLQPNSITSYMSIDLSDTENDLTCKVLAKIEKRMTQNFNSSFVDQIYYQCFENCQTMSDIEYNEEKKVQKLELCGKVLISCMEKEANQSYFINNYKHCIAFLYQLKKFRKSKYFKIQKKEIVYAIFKRFLLSSQEHKTTERLLIFMFGFYVLINEHIQQVLLQTIQEEEGQQQQPSQTKIHSFIYQQFAENWFINYLNEEDENKYKQKTKNSEQVIALLCSILVFGKKINEEVIFDKKVSVFKKTFISLNMEAIDFATRLFTYKVIFLYIKDLQNYLYRLVLYYIQVMKLLYNPQFFELLKVDN